MIIGLARDNKPEQCRLRLSLASQVRTTTGSKFDACRTSHSCQVLPGLLAVRA